MGCKVIAHRGANKKAPQNTIEAFEIAVKEKADGFETDIHLTKDGVPVVCHNYTIDETSDGVGEISSYTLDELRKFDFGSYFSKKYVGTRIPTLDEFLALAAFNNIEIINIELKYSKNRFTELVEKTLKAVEKYDVLDRVIISSFSPDVLKAVKRINPKCKTAFLYPTTDFNTARMQIIPFLTVKQTKCDIIHPAFLTVCKPIVCIAHKLGLKVNVWTVNDEKTIIRLLKCGVDGLITDYPLEVRKIIDEYEKGI